MSENVVSPEEVPVPQVDCDAVESAGENLKSDGSDVAQAGQDIKSSWQGLEGVYAAPESETLFAAIDPVATKGDDFDEAVTSVGKALITFAEEVRPIKARLAALKADAGDFQDKIAGDDDWREDEDRIDELDQLNNDILQAVHEYQRAERDCANAITSLFGGTTFVAADGDGSPGAGEQAHGTSEALQDVETPWVTPQEHDAAWYVDVWDGVKDFGVGIAEDVGGLVGLHGEDGWGVSSWGEWGDNLKNNYGGMLNGLGSLVGLYGEDGWGVGSFGEWWGNFSTGWTEFAHAIVPWREWGDRPGYVISQSVLNIGSMFVGAGVVKALVKGSRRAGGGGGADVDTRGTDVDVDVQTRHLDSVANRPGQQTTQDLQNTLDTELDMDQQQLDGIQNSLDEAVGFQNRTTTPVGGDRPVDTDPAIDNGDGGQRPQPHNGGGDSSGTGGDGGSGDSSAPGGRGGHDSGGGNGTGGGNSGDGSGDQQGGNQQSADGRPNDGPEDGIPGGRPDDAPGGDTTHDTPEGRPVTTPDGDRSEGAPEGDSASDAPGDRPDASERMPEGDGVPEGDSTPDGDGGAVDTDPVSNVDNDAPRGDAESPDTAGPGADTAPEGDTDPSEYPGHVDEDGVRRFESNDAGGQYGEEVLGDSYHDLPEHQQHALKEYTRNSWINWIMRGRIDYEGFRQWAGNQYGPGWPLMEMVGGDRKVTMHDIDNAAGRSDITPEQQQLVDRIRSAEEPQAELENVIVETGFRGRMIQSFDGFPTVDDIKNRVGDMDDAMEGNRLPEKVEVLRGLHGVEFMNGFDSSVKDPVEALRETKWTTQTEPGYFSSSLGDEFAKVDGKEFPYKFHITVPEGHPGVWMGKQSAYPEQRELILPRDTRYEITGAEWVDENKTSIKVEARVLMPAEDGGE